MKTVTLYGTGACPYCHQAEILLTKKNVAIEKIRIDQVDSERDIMIARSGKRSVPQLFVGDHHIGGFDALVALEQQGELDRLLNS